KFRLFAAQIESGMVYWNSMVKSTPELPFGGMKNSGIGRELGIFGIQEFTNPQLLYPF
ncbi:MAG: aldehyde dehydrogenase family protein, partial [Bacteroidota bacterium]|nr:aldehyde dehydrogenase family protein [Bacteroidota bacterium]MDX5430033.1 aldehyde dehydrogenase family protein [Bacteroidota bacterium]MDX5468803.1 aldehyde dehydrogenase family protein [Bacteroidota bacterium]